jgi:hypothetical protein
LDHDEDGEPVFPECVTIPPRLRDVALVTGMALRRLENGSTTARGYSAAAIEMCLQTTEGPFTFLLSRDDMSKAANGMVEVLCDT